MHPHEASMFSIARGLSPEFFMVKRAMAGLFQRMEPMSCFGASNTTDGCAKDNVGASHAHNMIIFFFIGISAISYKVTFFCAFTGRMSMKI